MRSLVSVVIIRVERYHNWRELYLWTCLRRYVNSAAVHLHESSGPLRTPAVRLVVTDAFTNRNGATAVRVLSESIGLLLLHEVTV